MTGITKLGKYLIRRELGKGAMGVVYEGFDPAIERVVAIKTILPQRLGSAESAELLARFKREAQAAGRLNHPGIVAVYDYGETVAENDDATFVAGTAAASTEPVAYIAMEFVKGRELRDYFEANERFALRDIERLMGEILAALSHAHAHGVIHRDIKPANLIVLDDGRVKIADFGIARVEKSELTQAGVAMGTPSYMSPEQFLGQPVDGRSDLFSCGVILYQFLTGEKPFTGTTTTIMYKVLREEPLAPSILNVALPSAFDAVVKKAMAKSPDQRFQTAEEFSAAIHAAVADQGTATHTAAAEATMVNAPAPASASVSTDQAPAALRPSANTASRPLLLGAAAVAVLAALGGAFLYLGKDRVPAQAPQVSSPTTAPATAQVPKGADTPATGAAAAGDPPREAGAVVISALGLVDPKDPRFNGDAAAAQAEARADARRQLVEKVVSLYVDNGSLNKNYALIEQKLLSQSGSFIKSVLQEGTPATGKDGLLETETRAVLRVRDVQKSLNQLSRDERIDFIRNNGDPKVSIRMTISNADTAQALPPVRSQLAENVVKERIKSFGFRVWANDGEAGAGSNAKPADFQIQGEAKVKLLSAKLAASGLTVTKTVLTSWTVKAIDKATGEEIYLNTVMPKGQSWATEDQALADIGKQMGDEFSKNFFLQHFNVGVRPISLDVAGLPDAATARQLLRELRSMRQVLDARLVADAGRFELQLPEGRATELVQEAIVKPLNAKLGQACFAITGSSDTQVGLSFAGACADAAVRGRFESAPPAGLLGAPPSRGAPLLRSGAVKIAT
jgi:serine/threonine-protein kinase